MTLESELRDRLYDAAWRVDSGGDDDAAAEAVIARRRAQRAQRAAVLGVAAGVILVAGLLPVVGARWLAGGGSAGTSALSSAGQRAGVAASGTGGSAQPSATSWGSRAGCPSTGRALPAGTNARTTVDVDGDGRADTAFISTQPAPDGGFTFGVRTASGAVLTASMGLSASPVQRSVLFADVTGHGEVIALASDGRQVQLWAVSACQLVPLANAQGQQYTFDLGYTGSGTGIGCADANGDGDGVRDLLGLKVVIGPTGNATSIQRTIVRLTGSQAVNGARSTVPSPTPAEVDQAGSITCGDLTMAANGVSSGP